MENSNLYDQIDKLLPLLLIAKKYITDKDIMWQIDKNINACEAIISCRKLLTKDKYSHSEIMLNSIIADAKATLAIINMKKVITPEWIASFTEATSGLEDDAPPTGRYATLKK